MTLIALSGAQVLVDDRFRAVTLLIDDGVILDLVEGAIPAGAERHDLAGKQLLPGFIDTQVNGGGGVLFNDVPTPEGIRAIGAAHRRFGTTGFLPTLISDDMSVVARAIAAVDRAIAQGVPGVLGIHIEGPFLNIDKRGIHDAAHIRQLDDDAVAILSGLRHGRTLVTLAPEKVDHRLIGRLRAAGVAVAAGHTDATHDQMIAAYGAGVQAMTHLFNAMSPMASRDPGAVGAALASPSIYCGLIADGIHVHPQMLRLALQVGPLDRFMLVTDAMPPVGADQDSFTLGGRRIFVRDGKCVDDAGTLAGALLTMADAVRNAVDLLGLSLEQAARIASQSPARFLGLERRGRIAPGMTADLVAMKHGSVTDSWISGQHLDHVR